jgi:hypothetical protein
MDCCRNLASSSLLCMLSRHDNRQACQHDNNVNIATYVIVRPLRKGAPKQGLTRLQPRLLQACPSYGAFRPTRAHAVTVVCDLSVSYVFVCQQILVLTAALALCSSMNASTLFNFCAHRLQGYRSSRGSKLSPVVPASKLQHTRNAARHNTTRVTLVYWPRLPPPAWLARGSGTGAPGGCWARTSGICGCSSQRAVTADKDADMFVAGVGAPSQPPHRRAQAFAPHLSQRLWLRVWPPAALIRVRRSVGLVCVYHHKARVCGQGALEALGGA